MAALLPEWRGRVDLLYADPPFMTGKRFAARIGRGEDSRKPDEWLLDEGYDDRWADPEAYMPGIIAVYVAAASPRPERAAAPPSINLPNALLFILQPASRSLFDSSKSPIMVSCYRVVGSARIAWAMISNREVDKCLYILACAKSCNSRRYLITGQNRDFTSIQGFT